MNQEKIVEAALALLYVWIHEQDPMTGSRTWKTFDWDVMERLHADGLIANPVGRAKSVAFTDKGLSKAEAAAQRLFGSQD